MSFNITPQLQRWNKIRILAEIVVLGVGQTGKTVTALVQRRSDGEWLQSGGGWDPTPDTVSLSALDAANFPGLYALEIDPGDLDFTAGAEGYDFVVICASDNLREHSGIEVEIDPRDVIDAVIDTAALVAGSLGDRLVRVYALRQGNCKLVWSAYDGDTGEPTTGTMYVYPDKAALVADSGHTGAGKIGHYAITTAYDVDERVTRYTSTEES